MCTSDFKNKSSSRMRCRKILPVFSVTGPFCWLLLFKHSSKTGCTDVIRHPGGLLFKAVLGILSFTSGHMRNDVFYLSVWGLCGKDGHVTGEQRTPERGDALPFVLSTHPPGRVLLPWRRNKTGSSTTSVPFVHPTLAERRPPHPPSADNVDNTDVLLRQVFNARVVL